jgi:hypothetical protein
MESPRQAKSAAKMEGAISILGSTLSEYSTIASEPGTAGIGLITLLFKEEAKALAATLIGDA